MLGYDFSMIGMTDNDRQRRNHKPGFIGKTERTYAKGLTHKAFCAKVPTHI